jgi:glycosyltransferase involved in cell wall biosynthesis
VVEHRERRTVMSRWGQAVAGVRPVRVANAPDSVSWSRGANRHRVMKFAYIFAEERKPVLRSTGHSVHVQEICSALLELGHQVVVLAGRAGDEKSSGLATPRIHQLRPPFPRPRKRATGRRPLDVAATEPNAKRRPVGLPTVAKDLLRVVRWRVWSRYFSWRARRILRHEAPDVLYERYVLGSTVGSKLARDLGLPLIVEMNASFTFEEEWWGNHSRIYETEVRRNEAEIAKRAQAIIVVSSRLKSYLEGLGTPSEKIVVLCNGADPARFRPGLPASASVRRRYGVADRIVVGFIGSLKPWHGVDVLLESARLVLAEDESIRFLIVGSGPLLEPLQALNRRENLEDHVRFTGYVARDEAPGYIGAMDIAVAPAPRLENYHFSPIKVFEYMSCGRALIAPRYADLATIVRHEENGLLVNPGDAEALRDAILELAGNAELRRKLGFEARRTIEEQYTWRRNAEVIVSLLARGTSLPHAQPAMGSRA